MTGKQASILHKLKTVAWVIKCKNRKLKEIGKQYLTFLTIKSFLERALSTKLKTQGAGILVVIDNLIKLNQMKYLGIKFNGGQMFFSKILFMRNSLNK